MARGGLRHVCLVMQPVGPPVVPAGAATRAACLVLIGLLLLASEMRTVVGDGGAPSPWASLATGDGFLGQFTTTGGRCVRTARARRRGCAIRAGSGCIPQSHRTPSLACAMFGASGTTCVLKGSQLHLKLAVWPDAALKGAEAVIAPANRGKRGQVTSGHRQVRLRVPSAGGDLTTNGKAMDRGCRVPTVA
jgi:hypothetical protein